MASMMEIGLSGLKSHQLALSTTGHNIANANTEGYSRQLVDISTPTPQKFGSGFIGSGATVIDIFRMADDYLTTQISVDTASFEKHDTFLSNISQLDSLLADPETGLAPGIDQFFSTLNLASNDPASIEGRELLLTESQVLVDRFNVIHDRLTTMNGLINQQLRTLTSEVSSLALGIASVNINIRDMAGGDLQPNDLLDQRDELIRELSEYVQVSTVAQNDNTVSIFVGLGQNMVIGPESTTLTTQMGAVDSQRHDILFEGVNNSQVVTSQIIGGRLGGLLSFRDEVLDPAFNSLGRMSLAIMDQINRQHQVGIDLDGEAGGNFFADINDTLTQGLRVLADPDNVAPSDRSMRIAIQDTSLLTDSDYELTFPGPDNDRFSIIRVNDGELAYSGVLQRDYPYSVEFDGISLVFDAGSFQAGDRFLLIPTRQAARSIDMFVTRPDAIALASPIRTESHSGNQGGGFVTAGTMIDNTTSIFTDNPGTLSPPLLIRFNRDNNYDVLDNSNHIHPVDLVPPLRNRVFTAGTINDIFPTDPGGTTVVSNGGLNGMISTNPLGFNGYVEEAVVVTTVNDDTGAVLTQRVDFPRNQDAQSTAVQLSQLTGVTASALSEVQLLNFQSDLTGIPLGVTLNGIDLTDPNELEPGTIVPITIPDPINADFLRDRINLSGELDVMGIYALSDGSTLTVRSTTGVDLAFEISGNTSDSVQVREGDLQSLYSHADLSSGMTVPISSSFDLDMGSGPVTVTLTPGVYTGNNVVGLVQSDIDRFLGNNIVRAFTDPTGKLVLEPVDRQQTINISNISSDDILGLNFTTITGPDQGALPATIANGADLTIGFNFSLGGPYTFDLSVDGSVSTTITLNANTSGITPTTAGGIVDHIQTQINAAAPAIPLGSVVASMDSNGVIRLTTSNTGTAASLILTNVNAGSVFSTNDSGQGSQTGGTAATVTGAVDVSSGIDFSVSIPNFFDISIDNGPSNQISLTQNILPLGSQAVMAGSADMSTGPGFNFSAGGPYSFDLSVDGVAASITLATNTAGIGVIDPAVPGPAGIVTYIQSLVDASAIGSSAVTVGIDNITGEITFTSNSYGPGSNVTIYNVVDTGASGVVVAGSNTGVHIIGSAAMITTPSNLSAGFDFSSAGPHTFDVSVNGGATASITLSLNTSTFGAIEGGLQTVNYIQAQIDASTIGSGQIIVGIDSTGRITYSSATTGTSSTLNFSAASGGGGAIPTAPSSATGLNNGGPGLVNYIQSQLDNHPAIALGSTIVSIDNNGFISISSATFGDNSDIVIENVVGTSGAILAGTSSGVAATNLVTIGGSVDVELVANTTMATSTVSGLFTEIPPAVSNFMGFQVSLNSGQGVSGSPSTGDKFFIDYNTDGAADSRNGEAMVQLNTAPTMLGNTVSFQGGYGQLVEIIGTRTSQARVNEVASRTLLKQSREERDALAGVNLDEEAGRLIKLEQAYNASARVITVASSMIETLLTIR